MEFAFYFAAGVAVAATFRVITNTNPVHALLYLIVSLLAVSMTFFALGARESLTPSSQVDLKGTWSCLPAFANEETAMALRLVCIGVDF